MQPMVEFGGVRSLSAAAGRIPDNGEAEAKHTVLEPCEECRLLSASGRTPDRSNGLFQKGRDVIE
eukprot:CAMPEP_0181484554 /NCGR_PEP_ID=MMETSP1110-20121109/46062_1 /TAXON_ID=174948 /ORGANISM="Symbiodinium sp., Strain CCMP421" /LENGTH=64 /DNA_ID=CAMNT_0023610431 /DNA_START=69 /DNA_END=260 /DNA_ORIENTATION=-